MEIKAEANYLRISPRKLRLLTKNLRGLSPQKAIEKLQFYPQKGKDFLVKLLKQGIANAVHNFKIAQEDLKIKSIQVGDGPSFKRLDKSHGARFDRGIIKKRTAHLFLTLEAPEKIEEKKDSSPKVKKAPGLKSDSKTVNSKKTRSKNGSKS